MAVPTSSSSSPSCCSSRQSRRRGCGPSRRGAAASLASMLLLYRDGRARAEVAADDEEGLGDDRAGSLNKRISKLNNAPDLFPTFSRREYEVSSRVAYVHFCFFWITFSCDTCVCT